MLLAAGLIDGPPTVEITIGTDGGRARETLGRVERVRPGARLVEVTIGSDRGRPDEPLTRVHRLRREG